MIDKLAATPPGPVAAPASPPGDAALDDTAEVASDGAATRDQELATRAALALLVQRETDKAQDLRLARMRDEFNSSETERAELLREMNVLRDMALEQMKKDDEILKKFIAMI